MYAATGGPNMKWGAQILNVGAGNHCNPRWRRPCRPHHITARVYCLAMRVNKKWIYNIFCKFTSLVKLSVSSVEHQSQTVFGKWSDDDTTNGNCFSTLFFHLALIKSISNFSLSYLQLWFVWCIHHQTPVRRKPVRRHMQSPTKKLGNRASC